MLITKAVSVMKSRRIRCADHEARMWRMRNGNTILIKTLEERSWSSSVGMTTRLRADNRLRIPIGAMHFSLPHCIETGSAVRLAS
jgi:hypothetical protein